MDARILPFPGKFRPRLAYTEENLDDFLFGSDDQTFLNLPIGPRSEFGLRERGEDRTQIDRIKDAARAARKAFDGKPDISADVEKASDIADELSALMRQLARVSGKAKYHLLAQDAEQLSERLCHALAEIG